MLAIGGAGVLVYAGVAIVSALAKRLDGKAPLPPLPPEGLEEIRVRLDNAAALEARVQELEERVDFAERMLATRHEAERLPGAEPLDPRH